MSKLPINKPPKYNICIGGKESTPKTDFLRMYVFENEEYLDGGFRIIPNFEKLIKAIEGIDILITDFQFEDTSGEHLIKELTSMNSHIQIIAVLAEKLRPSYLYLNGAMVVVESFMQRDQLIKYTQLAVSYLDSLIRMDFISESDRIIVGNKTVICADDKSNQAYALAQRFAKSKNCILILGESGVGKDMMAQFIHDQSGRKGTFISLNCSLFRSETAITELFGHKKGSFTGAISDKIGYLEVANGGTVFLDEVGTLQEDVQAMLLKFLDNGMYFRKGDNIERRSDVRIIAGTNELKKLSDKNEFRDAFVFRIAQHVIEIPPLRKRQKDLGILISYYFNEACQEYNTSAELTTEAKTLLKSLNYPGNIRTLKDILYESVILSTVIDAELIVQILKRKNLVQSN